MSANRKCSVCGEKDDPNWGLLYYDNKTPYHPLCEAHAFEQELLCPACETAISTPYPLDKKTLRKIWKKSDRSRQYKIVRCISCNETWYVVVKFEKDDYYFELGDVDGYPGPAFMGARRSRCRD